MDHTNNVDIYSQKLSDEEFRRIQRFMLDTLGIKLAPIKIVMVNSRLIKRLKNTGIGNFKDYLDYALSPEGRVSGEFECMIDELTTHKTDFFREPEHFVFLREQILPKFVPDRYNPFKIWSAGCSTGEEPYTMGMILSEYQLANPAFDFSIYATDVSNASVLKGVRAIYNKDSLSNVDKSLVRKYFLISRDSTENKVRVMKQLREKIHFSILNLVDDYFFQND